MTKNTSGRNGVSSKDLLNRVGSSEIRKSLKMSRYFLAVREGHPQFNGNVNSMSRERIERWVRYTEPTGRRPRSKLRMKWMDNTHGFCCSHMGIQTENIMTLDSDRIRGGGA